MRMRTRILCVRATGRRDGESELQILDYLADEWEAAAPVDRWLVILAWATLLGIQLGVL